MRSGFKENLSARFKTGDAELPKFGETSNGNPEPSPEMCSSQEGVEPRGVAPKLRTLRRMVKGEGTVQTANLT
jgi:hypothetical protein